MATRRKPGRPPKRPEERQPRRVNVRLREVEFRRLADAADGVPLAVYVRALVMAALRPDAAALRRAARDAVRRRP